jgi:hypothetical protein
MSRTRETWKARFANIGTRLVHKREDRNGILTFTGSSYMVCLSLRLHRDENRIVEMEMNTEQAEFLIYQLGEYLARAKEYNEDL